MWEFRYNLGRCSLAQLVAIPFIILLLCLGVLVSNMVTIGSPVRPGIDFAGGTAVTIPGSYEESLLMQEFSTYPLISAQSATNGWYLKFGPMSDGEFRSLVEDTQRKFPDAKIDFIGATFAQTLQAQAMLALIFSFIGMSIVVFVAFRALVPAGAVVLSAFADIAITAAIMHLVGIPLSLGTMAALLMLIGYSVDSDILLTTRILKRKGKLDEKFSGAFRTGIIMTTTTMAALLAMLLVSLAGQMEIIMEISMVLLIGLAVDIMNTWLTNAGLLKWYAIKRGER
ncbi:MAG: protein translocase subunit SecF [Methanomicrobiales archaeon]|nr:protein translocase subunit SecF [Methanomicrobiales archaeon]